MNFLYSHVSLQRENDFFIHPCLITKVKDFLYTRVSVRREEFFIHPCLVAKGKDFFIHPCLIAKRIEISYNPCLMPSWRRGKDFTAMSHYEGKSTKRTWSKPIRMYWSNKSKWLVESIEMIGRINRNDWSNQLKWLVESIKMIGRINRNDWLNQSNPIEVNQSDWSDDRSQSNPIEDLHFFPTLIDFDCSIDHFDWVRSIRPINLIEFNWVRSIRLGYSIFKPYRGIDKLFQGGLRLYFPRGFCSLFRFSRGLLY